MSLSRWIEKLRSEEFCMYEVVESGRVPEAVLGHLLCDYIEKLQMHLSRTGQEMHRQGPEAVKVKRAWLEGRASNVQLGRARALVQHQMALEPQGEALFFAWAATFACSEKALCAVLEGLRRRSGSLPIDFRSELHWLGHRLALLLEQGQHAPRPMARRTSTGSWLPMAAIPSFG